MSAVPKQLPVLNPENVSRSEAPQLEVPTKPRLSVVAHVNEDTTQYLPAPYWTRIAATFLDQALIALVVKVLSIALPLAMEEGSGSKLILSLMIPAAYFVYFMNKYPGQSPAKLLFKLRVVSTTREDGLFSDAPAIVGREILGKSLNLFTFGIGYLLPPFRKDKKALHDLLCKTRVIRYN